MNAIQSVLCHRRAKFCSTLNFIKDRYHVFFSIKCKFFLLFSRRKIVLLNGLIVFLFFFRMRFAHNLLRTRFTSREAYLNNNFKNLINVSPYLGSSEVSHPMLKAQCILWNWPFTEQRMARGLLDLPPELLLKIVMYMDHQDIAGFRDVWPCSIGSTVQSWARDNC